MDIQLKPETKEKLLFLAVCFGLVFLVYGVSLLGDFVFDDRYIIDHQALFGNLHVLGKIFTLPYWAETAGLYRPITLVSYTLNFLLFGSAPVGFHFVNVVLYAVTGFLLYLVVEKLFKKKLLAYLSAIIFLVLPIHTEAVANIIGRAEILALFFSLLCFLELLKDRPRAWLAGLWLFLAIGSKETAVATVPLAVMIVYMKEKKIWNKETLVKYVPATVWLTLGGLAYFALRFAVLGAPYFLNVETSLVENPLKFAAAGPRIFTALQVLWLYVEKSFLPLSLCSDYSYNQLPIVRSIFNGYSLLGLAILMWLIVSVFIFLKRAPLISLGSAFFVFSFLPVANIIFPTGTIMGERLMLYPSVGISFYLAFIFYTALHHRKKLMRYSGIGLLALTLVFYSVRSIIRSLDWLTEKQLFTSAARCAPNSVLSRSNLGAEYYLEGNFVAAKKELLLAQQIYDGYPKGINNLGLVYWKEGDLNQARALFLKALSFAFPYYGAYENLALLDLQAGNIRGARSWLLKLYSGDVTAADSYIQQYTGLRNP